MTRQPLFRVLLLALLGSLLAAPAIADEDEDEEQYRVEMIIFKQSGGDEERWPTRPAPAVHERYAELRNDVDTPGADVYRRADDDRQLSAVARRLGESGHYDVLVHTAWIQPGLDRQEAAAIALPLGTEMPGMGDDELPAGANGKDDEKENADGDNGEQPERAALPARPPEGLSGWVRVARERYLHVHLDLRWVDPERSEAGPLDRLHGVFIEDMEPVVTLQDGRRMRSGELHYIDHPVLGVIVRVDRVDN
ncbi:CsiV family protein [Aquisalimonas sp.]|uniref:CsiV family protein n=1 Tax=unclassified Aquisalimonas TaxID=2644645 RepID=UPI0025C64DBD|nr:CsiV family protein [Aquisalimonas sp.]